jgi:hypothetical protein
MKNVPIPIPTRKNVNIKATRDGSLGVRSAAIMGSAGSIASIAKAIVANIIAIRAMNSTLLSLCPLGVVAWVMGNT